MKNKAIEEQIISLKTAKLANNKGFNAECDYFYNMGSNYKLQNDLIIRTGDDLIYEAPTQSLLQKWLREKYNLIVWVYPSKDNDFFQFEINNKIIFSNQSKTYEQSLEIGLIKALKLIK